ncbi:hypothetical protein MJI37_32860, partial [Salmonella enterica subsp. enterica serovar Cerro]|nr:hypothetical protein [Salmonella enterica subsp. enterica serovar Cerro]
AEQVGKWAARHIVNRINAFKPTADRPFVLGLPTGGTPLTAYKVPAAATTISFRYVAWSPPTLTRYRGTRKSPIICGILRYRCWRP